MLSKSAHNVACIHEFIRCALAGDEEIWGTYKLDNDGNSIENRQIENPKVVFILNPHDLLLLHLRIGN